MNNTILMESNILTLCELLYLVLIPLVSSLFFSSLVLLERHDTFAFSRWLSIRLHLFIHKKKIFLALFLLFLENRFFVILDVLCESAFTIVKINIFLFNFKRKNRRNKSDIIMLFFFLRVLEGFCPIFIDSENRYFLR